MGQVWQATDTQLGREVALKILPDAFAADPDRLARFTREAQILASLNHPNIAAIYGIEEAEGTRALVLELVEGPTLPVDEALPIAKQIAEALWAREPPAQTHYSDAVERLGAVGSVSHPGTASTLRHAAPRADPLGSVGRTHFHLGQLALCEQQER